MTPEVCMTHIQMFLMVTLNFSSHNQSNGQFSECEKFTVSTYLIDKTCALSRHAFSAKTWLVDVTIRVYCRT